jgi:hypothetical protein
MDQNFETAFQTYFTGVAKITNDYMAKQYPTLPKKEFSYTVGKRYIRVVSEGSAHSFVDLTDGSVLKPAGFKTPAKHARGNIFDENNGLGSMGPYGPAYLR